jgi:hypothetical protein
MGAEYASTNYDKRAIWLLPNNAFPYDKGIVDPGDQWRKPSRLWNRITNDVQNMPV